MTTSVTSISKYAFTRCGAVASLIIKPAGVAGNDTEGDNANSGPWGVLAGNVIEDDDMAEVDAPDSPPTTIARLWAPDNIIKQLTGPFAAYNKFADLPRGMRAAPDAKTWAAVAMWQWWAAPTHVGEDRLACYDRRRTVFAVMLSGVRAEKTAILPGLPEELWLHVFGFLKHEQQPAFA